MNHTSVNLQSTKHVLEQIAGLSSSCASFNQEVCSDVGQ